ncbi:STAS domain-containing protein [Streptomyces sp. NPDC054961]
MTATLIDVKTAVRSDGDACVTLTGELDFHTAGQVEPLLTVVAASGYRGLVLDLSGISFCDSSGIGLFLRVHQRCQWSGTRLRLIGVPPLVGKSMRVLGADRVLRLVAA